MATWSPPGGNDTSSSSPPYSSAPPRIMTPELHEEPILDSPSSHTTTPVSPYNLFPVAPHQSLTPQSLPGTPQLSHRSASAGKLREGIKRMFVRPPVSQSSLDRNNPASSTEDPDQQTDMVPMPKIKRYNRLRIKRTFRRTKRRSDKGQYHSDDGYTSDPGPPMPDDPIPPPDMDDEEETDGAESSEGHGQIGVETRTERQKKELKRKLDKMKNHLVTEKEHYHETQTSYLQDLETTTSDKAQQRIKSRFQRDHVKSHTAIESSLKKIEKYEKDIASLQEGGAKEGLRGKIEGGLKAPFAGIKKGFNIAGNTLKKGKRYIIRTRSSQGGEGVLDGDGKYAVELIEEEEDEGEGEEALVLEESDMVTVPETTLEEIRKQHDIQIEEVMCRLDTVEEVAREILSKLGQVKDTYERLQEQVNDVIDLHQNAVGELRGQLAQVETMTVGKTQDLEDLVEDYQGKVEKLDIQIHNEIERKAEVEWARHWVLMVVARAGTLVLHFIAFILKLISLMSTRTGAMVAVAIAIIAALLFLNSSSR